MVKVGRQASWMDSRLGSKHVMLDFMLFEVKKLYLIRSPSMEPYTGAVKSL